MKKIIVTGGLGFIGSNLVDRLIDDGHDVIIIDDLSTGFKENLGGRAQRIGAGTAQVRPSARQHQSPRK